MRPHLADTAPRVLRVRAGLWTRPGRLERRLSVSRRRARGSTPKRSATFASRSRTARRIERYPPGLLARRVARARGCTPYVSPWRGYRPRHFFRAGTGSAGPPPPRRRKEKERKRKRKRKKKLVGKRKEKKKKGKERKRKGKRKEKRKDRRRKGRSWKKRRKIIWIKGGAKKRQFRNLGYASGTAVTRAERDALCREGGRRRPIRALWYGTRSRAWHRCHGVVWHRCSRRRARPVRCAARACPCARRMQPPRDRVVVLLLTRRLIWIMSSAAATELPRCDLPRCRPCR